MIINSQSTSGGLILIIIIFIVLIKKVELPGDRARRNITRWSRSHRDRNKCSSIKFYLSLLPIFYTYICVLVIFCHGTTMSTLDINLLRLGGKACYVRYLLFSPVVYELILNLYHRNLLSGVYNRSFIV